jgi:hypothetical protein
MQNNVFAEPIMAKAVHIDTVYLSHAYRITDLPPPEELKRRHFSLTHKPGDIAEIIIARSLPTFKKSYEPRLTVIISGRYCGIKVELSIAKLLDGNGLGVQTNDDIECALDAIDDYICGRIGVEFDSRTAKVGRLDVNADFPVGENNIIPYLRAISPPDSRLETGKFGTTTEVFFNGSRALEVYGKRKEMEKQFKRKKATAEDVAAADGLLRIEARLKTTQVIERLSAKLNYPSDAQYLLTLPVARKIMSKAISELEMDRPKFSLHQRDKYLKKIFKGNAPAMLGILEWRARYGEEFWRTLNWSPSKYYKKKRELKRANLWSVSPVKALPPLRVK